jgi:hypothetical protein
MGLICGSYRNLDIRNISREKEINAEGIKYEIL